MNILYVSFLTEDNLFEEIFNKSKIKPGQQVQKFNRLLAIGLSENKYNVTALSTPPISMSTWRKLFARGSKVNTQGINFNHIGFINLPIVKQICVLISGFFKMLKWAIRTKGNKVILCDTIAVTLSSLCVSFGKAFGIKTIGLITDLPDFLDMSLDNNNNLSFSKKMYIRRSENALSKYSGYVLLTKHMNSVINHSNKPYIVMEGMVDSQQKIIDNQADNKLDPPIVLYAGALFEKYGLKMLLDAFKNITSKAELYIYGDGDIAEDFMQAARENDNIKYFGVVKNDIVVNMEVYATLLINPRMSTQEFALYSFPSKNMEYMLSGTPVLTCNLPGMPEEYREYIYVLEDESIEGLTHKLDKILSTDRNTLHEKGKRAQAFVINNKSNIKQAKRIGDFINENLFQVIERK